MKFQALSLSHLELPAEVEFQYISTICEWERLAYGEGMHRTAEHLQDCVRKNRSGFFLLLDGPHLLGYIDVWELPENFYLPLKLGLIDEESIRSEKILARTDSRSGLWYIGSMITCPQLRGVSNSASAFAFSAICRSLPKFFHAHAHFPSRVLGVGSSSFGAKLLGRWGFTRVVADPFAVDHRPRFEKIMGHPNDANSFGLGNSIP